MELVGSRSWLSEFLNFKTVGVLQTILCNRGRQEVVPSCKTGYIYLLLFATIQKGKCVLKQYTTVDVGQAAAQRSTLLEAGLYGQHIRDRIGKDL